MQDGGTAAGRLARAKAVTREAQKQSGLGNYSKAIKGFERAYSLVSEPLLLYNIARMLELRRDDACALDVYRLFLSVAPAGKYPATSKTAKARAEKAMTRLEAARVAGRPPLTDGARYCPEP